MFAEIHPVREPLVSENELQTAQGPELYTSCLLHCSLYVCLSLYMEEEDMQ